MNNDGAVPERWASRGRPGHDQQSVLRAAAHVFNLHGYDATSMGNVAEILGISRSALYHHFTSKGDLLKMALDQALIALEDILVQPKANDGTAAERLNFVVQQMVVVLANQMPAVTLLLRLRGNTAVECDALDRRRAIEAAVFQLVSLGKDEGSIRSDVDSRSAARLLIGLVNSLVDWYDPRTQPTPPQLADEVLALAFHGLKP